jgi:hypothetical protein
MAQVWLWQKTKLRIYTAPYNGCYVVVGCSTLLTVGWISQRNRRVLLAYTRQFNA